MASSRGESNPLIEDRIVYQVLEMKGDFKPQLIEVGELETFLKAHINHWYRIIPVMYSTLFQY